MRPAVHSHPSRRGKYPAPEGFAEKPKSDVGSASTHSSWGRSDCYEPSQELIDVKSFTLPLVRRRGGGGREILCVAAARFQDRQGAEEHRRQPGRKSRFGAGGRIHL